MSKREILLLLDDMLQSARKIKQYTKGFDYDSFIADNKTIDAVVAGLDQYFQKCGLVSKLLPMKTMNTPWKINVPVLENLVLHTKLEKLKTIINNDQPRASGIIELYKASYYRLADYYGSVGRQYDIQKIIDSYKQNIMIGFKPGSEKGYLDAIEEMTYFKR